MLDVVQEAQRKQILRNFFTTETRRHGEITDLDVSTHGLAVLAVSCRIDLPSSRSGIWVT